MNVDCWFDPGCPWSWRTSRWLVAIAPDRDLHIRWRSLSVVEMNGGADKVAEEKRANFTASHRLLRVIERLRAAGDGGNEAVGRFYTEVGAQVHNDEVAAADVDVAAVLVALGHDPALATALGDENLDAILRASTAEARVAAGEGVGAPIVRIGEGAASGLVIDPVPTGDGALRLFDALATIAAAAAVQELKRERIEPPALLPRPATVIPARARPG